MKPAHQLPSVSVVIPTHDRPEFVREALRSVLEQDYAGRIEALVVFDGGEPADFPRSGASATRSVRVLTNDRKPGPLGTRNAGILAATGDIVAFLDDDDEWLPSKLSRQVEVLLSRPVDMVFSGVRFVAGNRQRDYIPRLPPDDPIRALIGGGVFLPIQTMIVWRKALEPDLLDENFPTGGDQELALRLMLRLRTECIAEPLVLMNRAHTKRSSMRYEKRQLNVEFMRVKHAALFAKYRPDLSGSYARSALLALGNRKRADARKWALRAIRANPKRARSWLVGVAVLVLPPISLETLQALHHRLLWRRVRSQR
jgi:glycosyltransferase involved in cell wall biosynthesis